MDELTFETFSWNADKLTLQNGLVCLANLLDIGDSEIRISGDRPEDDMSFEIDRFSSGEWQQAYGKFGRLFCEFRSGFFGVSREGEFEHLSVVLKQCLLDEDVLRNLFATVSGAIEADFSFMYGENAGSGKYFDIGYAANDSDLSIAAGLRDVYWLNFYGASFVEAIGTDTLGELTVYEMSRLNNGVLVRTTERIEDAYDLRNVIRNQIGLDCFVPKSTPVPSRDVVGVVGLVRQMLALANSPKERDIATIRPKFD